MFDREPFLKAIFADPDDDLPRLVYSDYLEEQGDVERAEMIRVQCELARFRADPRPGVDIWPIYGRNRELVRSLYGYDPEHGGGPVRGFDRYDSIEIDADALSDPDQFRRRAIGDRPEWYGATRLKIISGKIVLPGQVGTLLASPVTTNVTELDLSGGEVETEVLVFNNGNDDGRQLIETELRPVITVPMVELLAQSREARRLTDFDLTFNDLDNDAARAIARSPHLFRLRRLAFSRGNRFRGRVWQQLVERFGEHVVE